MCYLKKERFRQENKATMVDKGHEIRKPCELLANVLFLTEGGVNVGLGHVTRCVSLLRAFEKKGLTSKMIINGDDSVKNLLRGISFRIENWLELLTDIFDEIRKTEIVIVDSYLASRLLCRKISDNCRYVVYLDDNVRIEYPKGTVINGCIGAEALGYEKKTGVKYILGVKHIPLRPEFTSVPDKNIRSMVSEIVVTFGGDDTKDMTPRVVKLLRKEFPSISLKVLIGQAFRSVDRFESMKDEKTELIFSPTAPEIKKIMLASDIAISAGGQTLYELARVGVPTVAVLVANNQQGNISGLVKEGFIEYAGFWRSPDLEHKIVRNVRMLMPQRVREKKKKIGRAIVDGRGAARIVDKIVSQRETCLANRH